MLIIVGRNALNIVTNGNWPTSDLDVVTDEDIVEIYKAEYSYYSYDGYDYDDFFESLKEVEPKQKTITVYE